MNWFQNYLSAVFYLINELWLYMLIGFFIAGIVEEFVSEKRLLKYFGANNLTSLLRASATGFVVSACSCGAIPLAASLRQRGASTSTTLTFLLASPWLGVPMLLIYVKFLGLYNTLSLLAISLTVAISIGLILAKLERRGAIVQGKFYQVEYSHLNTSSNDLSTSGDSLNLDKGDSEEKMELWSFWRRLAVRVPQHAWVLGKDIGLYLLIGVFLAALPKTFLSPDVITNYLGQDSGVLGIFIAFLMSVAIEACSEGFAVVSGQLYHQGASLAVVFVMTMVGVATDFTELSMIWKKFGRRTTLVYVGLASAITLLVGVILQFII